MEVAAAVDVAANYGLTNYGQGSYRRNCVAGKASWEEVDLAFSGEYALVSTLIGGWMPNINIYVPAELHRKVRLADIAVSAVCQAALAMAVGEVIPEDGELTEGQVLARDIDDMRARLRRIAVVVEDRL